MKVPRSVPATPITANMSSFDMVFGHTLFAANCFLSTNRVVQCHSDLFQTLGGRLHITFATTQYCVVITFLFCQNRVVLRFELPPDVRCSPEGNQGGLRIFPKTIVSLRPRLAGLFVLD